MYKLLAAVVLVLGLGSCVSSQKAGQRASERQEVRRQVDEALDSRSFTVTFDYVMPHRLPARYLTTAYSLTVNGDSIDSYLPYFGVAYRSKYPDDTPQSAHFLGARHGPCRAAIQERRPSCDVRREEWRRASWLQPDSFRQRPRVAQRTKLRPRGHRLLGKRQFARIPKAWQRVNFP